MSVFSNQEAVNNQNTFPYNKPTRCTNFSFFFILGEENPHVSDSFSVHHQEFFTVHSICVCHTGLLTACKRDQDVPFVTMHGHMDVKLTKTPFL
jgi:hypothetical protein